MTGRINVACWLTGPDPEIAVNGAGSAQPVARIDLGGGTLAIYGSLPQLRRLGTELTAAAVTAQAIADLDELTREQAAQDDDHRLERDHSDLEAEEAEMMRGDR